MKRAGSAYQDNPAQKSTNRKPLYQLTSGCVTPKNVQRSIPCLTERRLRTSGIKFLHCEPTCRNLRENRPDGEGGEDPEIAGEEAAIKGWGGGASAP